MMKLVTAASLIAILFTACKGKDKEATGTGAPSTAAPAAAPAAPPPLDPNNIVSIAIASKDHTTLVAALKAADYVTAIANPGPLTVFAPTDAAFAKLPPGTVEELVKPAKQADLKEILKYHATTSVYMPADLKDGMTLGMSNGAKVQIKVSPEGTITVNDATILASVRASNGAVHVIDGVLLPPAK
ncbi:MAG: fasciclin domain-containing protein [Kofleriaceae bacterium]|nr:fasciclin domain-containing protein [Kofleriaceae bacterium]MCL4228040.1 fasciclin domain-containing protein [Myxococcales bacterium]